MIKYVILFIAGWFCWGSTILVKDKKERQILRRNLNKDREN